MAEEAGENMQPETSVPASNVWGDKESFANKVKTGLAKADGSDAATKAAMMPSGTFKAPAKAEHKKKTVTETEPADVEEDEGQIGGGGFDDGFVQSKVDRSKTHFRDAKFAQEDPSRAFRQQKRDMQRDEEAERQREREIAAANAPPVEVEVPEKDLKPRKEAITTRMSTRGSGFR